MIYFLLGFIIGGCSGVILTGIIAGRKAGIDE